jgi:hypothetical protein
MFLDNSILRLAMANIAASEILPKSCLQVAHKLVGVEVIIDI